MTRRPATRAFDPREKSFYARDVHQVARDLVGCTVRHGATAGRIVEVESYHQREPACHAYVGLTGRTRVLFGPPGRAYVYRSYGIHALLNAVSEEEGVGAAVLIRALEPVDGIDVMRTRRLTDAVHELCNGPGKLTQALGIGLDLNDSSLIGGGAIEILPPANGDRPPELAIGERIGIRKAVDLPWRFCDPSSRSVSRPWPKDMRPQASGLRQFTASRSQVTGQSTFS